ncbi:MAG: glycosyltransferase, partial [Pseudomonadota bacterium]|nr:glycosyltransferase [Pseudomonadota bacterium]
MAPELLIVVDTEEEFDWSKPFSRAATSTRSIPAQARAHRIYDRFGIVPTYVVDYPVATDPKAARFLRGLRDEGRAEIGVHLHPWVTPPHGEEVSRRNSYHCNLPPELERAKIVAATEAVAEAFGERPTVFKAGRYGFGPNTARVLAELGYCVDCSKLPHTDLRSDGGPDFRGTPADPHWLPEGLLEVPLTIGFFGAAASAGPRVAGLFDSAAATRLR